MSSVIYDQAIPVKDLKRSKFNEKDDYEEVEEVGAGSNGRCVLLKRKSDHALRVCKIAQRIKVRGRKDKYEDKPLEASILLDVLPKHERILRLHDALIQASTVQLYYDYYSQGDLSDLIWHHQKNMESIPEAFLWHAFVQLTEALAFLHTGHDRRFSPSIPADWRPVIHGDLKPANIFLSPPNPDSTNPMHRLYPNLIIGDFGLATLEELNRVGTLVYQPPEMPATTKKADVWALGAIMHKMAHYEEPIAKLPARMASTSENLLRWYWMPESRVPQHLDEYYTLELHDCVFECFTPNPKGRIDSVGLAYKVWNVFRTEILPYIDQNLEPLLPFDLEDKSYDANGVTEKTIEHPELEFLTAVDTQGEGQKDAVQNPRFDWSLEERGVLESTVTWGTLSEDWESEDSMVE